MRFGWSLVACLCLIGAVYAEEENYDPPSQPGFLDFFGKPKIPLPGLDIFTKPKIQIPGLDFLTKPKVPASGFQINKQIVATSPFGGGSFGFGFGFGGHIGGSPPGAGVNLPPAVKPGSGKPAVSWEDEDKNKESPYPRPNWGEEEIEPRPGSYGGKDKTRPEAYENEKDKRPDWEEIGEVDHENRSDDMMEGDLVRDGLIQPRLNKNRMKRFIDSKIYHVALLKGFISNARVSKVKFHHNDNSINSGM